VPDERLPTYQKILQTNGYRTGLVGKWHMDSYYEPRPGFDYWAAFQGQGVHVNPVLRVKKYGAPVSTINATGFTTSILTDYALDFLKDYGAGGTRTEPFALTLSFKAVHGPHGDQYTESGGLYANEPIDRPPNATPGYGGFNINEEKPVYSLPGLNGLTLNNTMGNVSQISQMEMMHDIDSNIGRVLDALEAQGLDDNTLVIFTSDNGFFWGEHGRGDKRLAYDESIRVPLLMRGPGVREGQTSDALVTNIDVAPTILTAAGIDVPKSMQGQSLNGLLSGSGGFIRDAVFAEYYPEVKQPGIVRWDAVRTESHLYVTHPEAGPQYDELYDLSNDPFQMNNLLLPGPAAALPAETQQVLAQLQERLIGLRQEANGVNPFMRELIYGSPLDGTMTEAGPVQIGLDVSRVGANTDLAQNGTGRAAVLAYELPRVDDPALLERAFVSFHVVSQTGNVSNVRADLWAIGITDDNAPLAEYLEADTELNLPNRADNLKLQDNIVVMGNHLARTFSSDRAALLLADYLRDFYDANPNYEGGRFLQVRLNPDRDLGAVSAGWDISTMEAPTSTTDPRPFTFRQPALVVQLARSDIVLNVPTGAVKTQADFGYPQITSAKSLTKTGGGTLVLDATNPFAGTVTVQEGTLRIAANGAVASSALTVKAEAAVKINAGVTMRATSLTLSGGTLDGMGATILVDGTSGIGQLAILSGSVVGTPRLTVSGSGKVSLPTNAQLTMDLTSLTVDQATGGQIDIGKGRITVAAGGITEAALRADVIAGRAGGSFSGTSGITTTGGPAGLATTAVVGYRVLSSSSAIVAWAAFGDANLDGQVNSTDTQLINNGGKFGQGSSSGATWVQGDFNYSGGVTNTDVQLLNNAGLYGTGSYLRASGLTPLGGAAGSPSGLVNGDALVTLEVVPEPSASMLALTAVLVLFTTSLRVSGHPAEAALSNRKQAGPGTYLPRHSDGCHQK
jgi:autotransporter-associated beta strand protein